MTKKYGNLIAASVMTAGFFGTVVPGILDLMTTAMDDDDNNVDLEPLSSSSSSSSPSTRPPTIIIIAYVIAACFLWSISFGFASWWRSCNSSSNRISTKTKSANNSYSYNNDNDFLCICACVGDIVTISLMEAFNFPVYQDSALIPEYIWLLFLISANLDLAFQVKTVLGILTFMGGLGAAVRSPLIQGDDLPQTVGLMVASTVLHIVLHYFISIGQSELVTVHGARAVLATVFGLQIWNELDAIQNTPNHNHAGSFVMVKASFMAAAGLAACGAFRNNIDHKERLEVLVQERTQQIQKQKDKLHMVGLALEASETAIAITDAEQKIIWFNPALERLVGKQQQQKDKENNLLQNSSSSSPSLVDVLNLSKSDARKLLETFDADTRKENEIMVGDNVIINAEVSPFCRPITTNDDDVDDDDDDNNNNNNNTKKESQHRFVVVLKDITEYRALQRAEKAAEQEALMARAMSESMETLTHELRTPLQGIMGICSILVGDETIPDDAREPLSLIMASSGLLLVLINNLLDIRKCNANMMEEFQLTPTQVNGPMNDSADFCRPLAAISGVGIDLEFGDAEHAVVMASNLRLQQVLINLTSNGIKYTSGGSKIRISSRTSKLGEVLKLMKDSLASGPEQTDWETASNGNRKVLVISVADAGAGIAPGQEKRMFRKFSQLNSEQKNNLGQTSVGQPSGTGLGLNLCLKFVHLMKGNIWVNNNVDCPGSTFSFYLPLVSNTVMKHEERRLDVDKVPIKRDPVSTFASYYRVLVVDDTLINRKVLDRMLRRIGVGHVKTVESGSAALEELKIGDYNLIITDLQMPGMSGIELCEIICETMPERPVIVGLTADTSEDVDERCIASGMADVIHKPITVMEMHDYFETVVVQLSPTEGHLRTVVAVR